MEWRYACDLLDWTYLNASYTCDCRSTSGPSTLKSLSSAQPRAGFTCARHRPRYVRRLVRTRPFPRWLTLVGCWCRHQIADAFVSALTTPRALPWTNPQPRGSFAPVREGCRARFLVDGMPCFAAMATAFEAAREEILIAGWWVCPDLVLRRHTGDDSRYAWSPLLPPLFVACGSSCLALGCVAGGR